MATTPVFGADCPEGPQMSGALCGVDLEQLSSDAEGAELPDDEVRQDHAVAAFVAREVRERPRAISFCRSRYPK